MKKLSKVTVKQEFIPKKEYALADVCNGEYKPLTQKETKLLNELFAREIFNSKGWCMISHSGITRPLFIHQYKKGKVVPKSKTDSIWKDGNVDPKYILTTKGFVLAGENYGSDGSTVNYDNDSSQWTWTNGVDPEVQTFDVDYVDSQKKQ
jgi:hypothetical protein